MYYFSVIVGETVIQDFEGSNLSSLDEAQESAIEDARGLMSAAVLKGRDISHQSIRITDDNGAVLLVVKFSDAITPD